MLTRVALAAAFVTGLTAAALAEEVPKTVEDCLKTSFNLAKSAAEKKLGDDKLAKIEVLLTTLEGNCDANRFAEAASVAKDVKTAIDGK